MNGMNGVQVTPVTAHSWWLISQPATPACPSADSRASSFHTFPSCLCRTHARPTLLSDTPTPCNPHDPCPLPLRLLRACVFVWAPLQVEALTLMGLLGGLEGAPPPPNPIEADVRSAVYQAAARSSDWETYNQLQVMYRAATDPAEKQRLLLALGYAPGDRVTATLDFSLTPDVRAQDVKSLILSTAANGGHSGALMTWRWLLKKAELLLAKLGGDDEAALRVAQAAEGVASLFAEHKYLAEVDKFFANQASKGKQSDPGYAARAKESIEANTRFVATHGAAACSWVQAQAAAAGHGR